MAAPHACEHGASPGTAGTAAVPAQEHGWWSCRWRSAGLFRSRGIASGATGPRATLILRLERLSAAGGGGEPDCCRIVPVPARSSVRDFRPSALTLSARRTMQRDPTHPANPRVPGDLQTLPGIRVSLFVTCLVDQLWPSIGVSTVEVLRRVGCAVDFDASQTCCGQPAFNTGYRADARLLAERFIEGFEATGCDAIVSPSGSCTAMVRHYPDLFPDDAHWRARARAVAERTHELGAFLVRELGVEDVGATFPARLTWHDACHALRDLGVKREPRLLLDRVRGAELVEMPEAEACCGFGGTFSVKYPEISVSILDRKIESIEHAGVDVVVSSDASCLMQISGRLSRRGSRVRALHLAEVLASTG